VAGAATACERIESLVREWVLQLKRQATRRDRAAFRFERKELLTLQQLASRLMLTRERVRQIQLEALAQLRRILRRRGLSKESSLEHQRASSVMVLGDCVQSSAVAFTLKACANSMFFVSSSGTVLPASDPARTCGSPRSASRRLLAP